MARAGASLTVAPIDALVLISNKAPGKDLGEDPDEDSAEDRA